MPDSPPDYREWVVRYVGNPTTSSTEPLPTTADITEHITSSTAATYYRIISESLVTAPTRPEDDLIRWDSADSVYYSDEDEGDERDEPYYEDDDDDDRDYEIPDIVVDRRPDPEMHRPRRRTNDSVSVGFNVLRRDTYGWKVMAIIELINHFHPEAASWVRKNLGKCRGVNEPEYLYDLDSLLIWRNSPQGHTFWKIFHEENLDQGRYRNLQEYYPLYGNPEGLEV